ncbi:uncharacterized mitochondrial protein AtMg00860-like [Carya illinoinensis]|uniref:uncharacterized mitochondrial protein AtMg00860-like n=1 Tax=Carya illinoinensis TaxID=32201 RepID=UPI001C7238BE|nr:uncharacterized mitochondrial protein AtMg00860-like [Carya illinoinensis]
MKDLKTVPPLRKFDHRIPLKEEAKPVNVAPYRILSGHLISHDGVKVDVRKVEAMVEGPKLKTITELRSFLELMGYYRNFVKDYASIARPLTNILKKNNFVWREEVEKGFEDLKKVMTTTPILAIPNFEKTFELHTDASNVGEGVVLTQEGRPLVFISKTLGI